MRFGGGVGCVFGGTEGEIVGFVFGPVDGEGEAVDCVRSVFEDGDADDVVVGRGGVGDSGAVADGDALVEDVHAGGGEDVDVLREAGFLGGVVHIKARWTGDLGTGDGKDTTCERGEGDNGAFHGRSLAGGAVFAKRSYN